MKRILFHIGTHKTATTSIQNALAEQRDALRAAGVLYPITERPPFPHHHKHSSLTRAVMGSPEEFAAERDLILGEFEASGCDMLVLSAEGLSGLPPERLERVAAMARGYDCRALCFLRRQDIFVESWWNQRVKIGVESDPIDVFCESDAVRDRLRYDRFLIDGWGRFARVVAVDFDAARKAGVVAAFTAAADLPALAEATAINVSPSMNCALVMMEINRLKLKDERVRLMRAFRDDRSRHVLGSRLRRQILEDAAGCNRRIASEYGVVFGSDLPEEAEQPLVRPDPEALARAMVWMSRRLHQLAARKAPG